jgi:hypothetical protein
LFGNIIKSVKDMDKYSNVPCVRWELFLNKESDAENASLEEML